MAEQVAALLGMCAAMTVLEQVEGTLHVLEQVVASSKRKRPRTIRMYLHAVQSFLDFAGRDPGRWNGAAVEA